MRHLISSQTASRTDSINQIIYRVYKNLENLLLLSATSNFESYEEEFNFIADFYGSDIDRLNALKVELETLSASCNQVMGDTKDVRLSDVLELFRQLSKPMLGMISGVVTLIKLLVMPAKNASSKRTFSALRRIKTYLRTTDTNSIKLCNGFTYAQGKNRFIGIRKGR